MNTCRCWFCANGLRHPEDRHPYTHRISDRPLKAESLDPKDFVQRFACTSCGHVTERPSA